MVKDSHATPLLTGIRITADSVSGKVGPRWESDPTTLDVSLPAAFHPSHVTAFAGNADKASMTQMAGHLPVRKRGAKCDSGGCVGVSKCSVWKRKQERLRPMSKR